jgi:hypothetical protein
MFIFLYTLGRIIRSANLYLITDVNTVCCCLVSRAASILLEILASFLDRGSRSKFVYCLDY